MPEASALHELTLTQAARLIRNRAISPVELVDALLRRAAALDEHVQAWVELDAVGAIEAARTAEAGVRGGVRVGPLEGVPFGAKDIFDTAGLRTMAGFPPFQDRVPDEDAAAVAGLKSAGAILLGKTATTQFAYADPAPTRNPWNADRTPGGSSSGSAAGVSAREIPLALGSQTAGSVLRPAAYCGVVGFKPSFGRISRRGVIPFAWSLDHVGMLTRSVEDCAAVYLVLAGYDPRDPSSAERVVDPVNPIGEPKPPRLGLLRPAVDRAVPQVRAHLEKVAARFASAGAQVEEVRLQEPWDLMLAVHHVTMQIEGAAVHWQLLEQFPDAYAPRLRAFVEVGRHLPGVAYLHGQRIRQRIRADFEHAVSQVDALLLPTAVDVAPAPDSTGDSALQAPITLVGLPSISLPSGLSEERLPLAVQLVGARWQEPALLEVARWCESRLGHLPAPPLAEKIQIAGSGAPL